ncbi:MAG: hypothetical protein KAI64_01800, partial [Thermoplasmata archaeon]|nr:hypothetical protein [Thermoplasmata archaeon]
DLGFSRKHIMIVFSGARGYHLHVRDPKVQGLQSHERREIVDYISGPSREDIERFIFKREAFDKREFKGKVYPKYIRRMPKRGDISWAGKMRIGIENLLRELSDMGKDKAIGYMAGFEGIGTISSGKMWRDLFEGDTKGADRMLREDNLEVFSSDKVRDAFIRIVVESQKVKLEGETDEPVTSDTKRLIRLPTSLHGKTGFLVKRLELEELDDFEPLRDAIPSNFGTDKTNVKMLQPVKMDLGGEKFNLGTGIYKVPEYAAIFFMCRRLAALA